MNHERSMYWQLGVEHATDQGTRLIIDDILDNACYQAGYDFGNRYAAAVRELIDFAQGTAPATIHMLVFALRGGVHVEVVGQMNLPICHQLDAQTLGETIELAREQM